MEQYEEFASLEEAENRAKEVYPEVKGEPVLGSWWMANGYIQEVEGLYRLDMSR